jgi:DNA repair protein RadC
MIDNKNNPPILSRLDDSERDDIITDEELEEIGVAYGSQERYEEAMRGLAGRLSGAKMGLRDDVSVGDGRKSPKIKAGESTVPVGALPKIKRINITGKSILSADDAAQLFSVFRDPRIEIFNIAYVSKSKEVLAHTAWTCGLPTLVSNADGKTFEDGLSSIQTTMKQLGADKIWIAHNHPSGNPDPSIEDKRSTMAYASFLKDRFAGHIILDHDEYSIVFHNGTSMRLPLNEPVEDFETEKRRKASVVSGSKDIASMFKKVLSDSDEDTVVHAVLDNRNRVVSWAYGETNYTNEIKDYMRISGGKTVITITNSESLFEEYCFKANNALNSKHDIFLDIVLVNRETGNLRLSHAKSESYFGGNWQLNEAKELKYVVKNFALQHEKKLSQAPNPPLSRGEAINVRKERSMSDEFSELEDLSPKSKHS